jgi:hypothetical protein
LINALQGGIEIAQAVDCSDLLAAFAATFATRLIASAISAWASVDTAWLRSAARAIAARTGLFRGRRPRLSAARAD